ncbi:DUF6502 family protein [Variovorax sp. YR216]|uniref:DUF6502 family protein n=1 Tax=Variovorax sp. YR216 TaxID=1882828 RepID=UPI0008989B0C|nr:DUF6502 family protein [Variovorax sp. YR216]SEA16794.1 hypothetical protein SAMN05444680_101754 [Variovorax sp. YR216]
MAGALFWDKFPKMDAGTRMYQALEDAVSNVLRALFRVVLRHSMSYSAFDELARRAYVEVAMKDFAIEGKKSTISRASILSGLTRKEVRRLLSLPVRESVAVGGERYNRAARVLTGWVRDPSFLDTAGEPRALQMDGPQGFAELVRRHSGDMPARAVLDELQRVGAVECLDDQHVQLHTRAFVPACSASDKLGILGRDVPQLIATIDHNIQHGAGDPHFQRKVMYDAIPRSDLPAFRKLSATQAQSLLERMDRWLQVRDRVDAARNGEESAATPRRRVGLGIYYFEEPAAPTSQGEAG